MNLLLKVSFFISTILLSHVSMASDAADIRSALARSSEYTVECLSCVEESSTLEGFKNVNEFFEHVFLAIEETPYSFVTTVPFKSQYLEEARARMLEKYGNEYVPMSEINKDLIRMKVQVLEYAHRYHNFLGKDSAESIESEPSINFYMSNMNWQSMPAEEAQSKLSEITQKWTAVKDSEIEQE